MSNTNQKMRTGGNDIFRNCSCPDCEKTEYSIIHKNRPLQLPEKLMRAIEVLLWYSPNNNTSVQSYKDIYLDNIVFEEALLHYFLEYSQLNLEDVCFIEKRTIPLRYIEPFENKACNNCQKIIVCKKENQSKLTSIIKHMRNCLAHGRFNLLSQNAFIGFDKYDDDQKVKYTACFKLDINTMYEFCMQLINFSDFTISWIFQYLLKNNNFSVYSEIGVVFDQDGNKKGEELLTAQRDGITLQINCSRIRTGIGADDIYKQKEISPQYFECDRDSNDKTNRYIVFYSENSDVMFEKISGDKVILGYRGLVTLFNDGNLNRLLNVFTTV